MIPLDLEETPIPPIWGQDVKEDYINSIGAMPNYVEMGDITNKRRYMMLKTYINRIRVLAYQKNF